MEKLGKRKSLRDSFEYVTYDLWKVDGSDETEKLTILLRWKVFVNIERLYSVVVAAVTQRNNYG